MPEENQPKRLNKKEFLISFFLVLVSLVIGFILLSITVFRSKDKSKPRDTTIKQTVTDETKTLKGVSFSPKSQGLADFTSFFSQAKLAGSVVTWSGPWSQLSDLKSAPYSISSLSNQSELIPIAVAAYFTENTDGKTFKLPSSDLETQKLYAANAAKYAEKFKPKFFGLGNEVNRLAKQSAEEIAIFSQFFNLAASEIKKVSPKTKVFTVFQLEQMKGLNGGLFGGTNDINKNQWSLLEKFNQADFFAFTSYPSLIYKTPEEIPDSYYNEIKEHTAKSIAFTELGWPSDSKIVGWTTTQTQQVTFLARFFESTRTIKPLFSVWPFLYDPSAKAPFDSMGLIYKSGTEKQAYSVWLNLDYD